MRRVIALSIILGSFHSNWALGWGERGHWLIGATAARLVGVMVDQNQTDQKALAKFFLDRDISMGHLSNVPDTAWKNRRLLARVSRMNSPNHYFGVERILGAPKSYATSDLDVFFKKIEALPTDYQTLKKLYHGKPNVLPGVPKNRRKLVFYKHLGTTPWRSQELFSQLVEAFRCASGKGRSSLLEQLNPLSIFGDAYIAFREPKDRTGEKSDPPLPTYLCRDKTAKGKKINRKADLTAAVALAGVLGHFVGDQAQPYHPTADHDGWVTGNGGLHSYFESSVVRAMDTGLIHDVYQMASQPAFIKNTWQAIGADTTDPGGVTKVLYRMAIDAQRHKDTVEKIDTNFAVIKKSAVLKWGDHPRFHRTRIRKAVRKDASDPKVLKAFRPVLVERLATGAVALARLWYLAWEQAGSPDLSDLNVISLPYPHYPPFVWPGFDLEYLAESKKAPAIQVDHPGGRDPYPAHWWKPVRRKDAPKWEILPQDAGKGEVILSKRNELGLMSNFADTPLTFRGKKYGSIEGLWQSMKYPAGKNDPRAKLKWKYTRDQVAAMVGFQAKQAGKLAAANMKKLGIEWISFEGKQLFYKGKHQQDHYAIILAAIREKVRQNPQVKKVLLQTGDLKLLPDHSQPSDAPPSYRYFDMYMLIRAELKKPAPRFAEADPSCVH